MRDDFDKIFKEFDKIFQEDWPFNGFSGFSGFSGFAGYSGMQGFSGLRGFSGTFGPTPHYSGSSYTQKVSDHIDKIDKHIEDIGKMIDDFDSGPSYEKKPFKIPKEVYYIFGIIAAAGITLFILSILEGFLKGR